jgi:hypothetical protein
VTAPRHAKMPVATRTDESLRRIVGAIEKGVRGILEMLVRKWDSRNRPDSPAGDTVVRLVSIDGLPLYSAAVTVLAGTLAPAP